VFETHGDLGRATPGAKLYGGQVVSHFAGFVAAILGVAQAELAGAVESPTLDRRVVEKRAVVPSPATRNCQSSAPRSETHGRQVISQFTRFVAPTLGVSEAEPAKTVIPPTLQRSVVEQRTCVLDACCDVGCAPPYAEAYGRKALAHFCRLVATRTRFHEAELAVRTLTPTLHQAGAAESARVELAGADDYWLEPTLRRAPVTRHLIPVVARLLGRLGHAVTAARLDDVPSGACVARRSRSRLSPSFTLSTCPTGRHVST
jgi:hypothetical protein